jgi:hypothetical protein
MRTRARISMMSREHHALESEAGYIDARPHIRQIDVTPLHRRAGPYIGSASTDRRCPRQVHSTFRLRTYWCIAANRRKYGLTANWSAKIEFDYFDFGKDRITVVSVPGVTPPTRDFDVEQTMALIKGRHQLPLWRDVSPSGDPAHRALRGRRCAIRSRTCASTLRPEHRDAELCPVRVNHVDSAMPAGRPIIIQ